MLRGGLKWRKGAIVIRPKTHISYSVLFFPELDSAARPLSYLFQFHLVIPKLGNRKNKYVQLSSHIMGISKEQETSCSILV